MDMFCSRLWWNRSLIRPQTKKNSRLFVEVVESVYLCLH